MTSILLERPEETITEINEVNKEELCKKLCLNIFEGLLEGYEDLKLKNPEQAESFEIKINELKKEINKQAVVN